MLISQNLRARGAEVAAKLALVIAAACALCGLAFLLYGIAARPYTEIEAQLVFQADRLRHHLPLYTDPLAGAWEAGAPPSRFHVLYPPLWVFLLAHAPVTSLEATRTVGRAFGVALLLVTLAFSVRSARPENRRLALTAACLALGLDLVVREAGLAQADVPAIALATFGLARANQRGRIDGVSAALLAAAPFVKHSILGVVVGAFVAHVIASSALRHPGRESGAGVRAMALPLGVAAAVSAAFAIAYHFASGGAWLIHIVRATGQPLSFERWTHEFGSRVLLLGLPHAVVLALALKRRAPLLATLPLATSLAWAIVTLAKHGSSTHYWLEPTLACVVVLGAMPATTSISTPIPNPIPHPPTAPLLLSVSGLALAIAVAASSLPAFARAPSAYADQLRAMNEAASTCALSKGEVAMSSDVRLEVMIDGRPIIPAWETSHMVRAGKFPIETWREDLLRPEVRCVITEAWFDDPLPTGSAFDDVSVYRRELRATLEKNFKRGERNDRYLVFHRD